MTPDRCAQSVQHAVKHRGGALNLVVPTSVGEATFIRDPAELSPELMSRALTDLAGREQAASRAAAIASTNGRAGCLVFDIAGTSLRRRDNRRHCYRR